MLFMAGNKQKKLCIDYRVCREDVFVWRTKGAQTNNFGAIILAFLWSEEGI